jgi:hypothetical protein
MLRRCIINDRWITGKPNTLNKNRVLITNCLCCISSDLLDTTNELEVSYNAAGILCHMAYDGPGVWTCDTVTREMAMEKLVRNKY